MIHHSAGLTRSLLVIVDDDAVANGSSVMTGQVLVSVSTRSSVVPVSINGVPSVGQDHDTSEYNTSPVHCQGSDWSVGWDTQDGDFEQCPDNGNVVDGLSQQSGTHVERSSDALELNIRMVLKDLSTTDAAYTS